jgi:predicted  nucleic acid-binding Zn-ribbon protein
MSVTEKLLRVFRVDQQLQGLQSRLRAAERFLEEQDRQLRELQAAAESVAAQLRQIQVLVADEEGEVARIDARIASLREQMNRAKTNKEYQAFLVEVNTLKIERDHAEQDALEQLTKSDELKKQLAELTAQVAEREKVRAVAVSDRDKRAQEISGRLNELKAERAKLVAEVPADALALYQELQRIRGDDAMAPVEEADRRRHEATCGSCMMSLPVETLSTLISGKSIVRCVSCGCILYIEKDVASAMQPAAGKR